MSAQIPAFPSFNWLRGVSDDLRISIVHRIVLIRLCLHRYSDSGKCDPTHDDIADELGVHRATVIRAIEAGVKFGWLVTTRRGPAASSYVFTFPVDLKDVAPERHHDANDVAPERHHGRKRCRSRAQMMSHACTNDVAPEQQTLIRETLSGDSERETKTLSAPDVGSPDEKKATD